MKNAKQKAGELAKFLHCTVGKAVAISEESSNEWEGSSDLNFDSDLPVTVQQRISSATVHVSAKVSATFELKSKGKVKEPKT